MPLCHHLLEKQVRASATGPLPAQYAEIQGSSPQVFTLHANYGVFMRRLEASAVGLAFIMSDFPYNLLGICERVTH